MLKPPLLLLPPLVALLTLASCGTQSNNLKSASKPPASPEPKVLQTQHGLASWYSVRTNFGTKTASGRPFKNHGHTAAHKHWPMGSKVRVTCLFNGKSKILTITDRGPYVKGRIIDIAVGCSKELGFYSRGITKVKVELLERGTWKYRHPKR